MWKKRDEIGTISVAGSGRDRAQDFCWLLCLWEIERMIHHLRPHKMAELDVVLNLVVIMCD